MQTLTLRPTATTSALIPATTPKVYINDSRRRDLTCLEYAFQPAPDFGRAVLTARPPVSQINPTVATPTDTLPAVGDQVRLAFQTRSEQFIGTVSEHQTRLDGQEVRHLALVTPDLANRMDRPITGRTLDGPVRIDGEPLRFNITRNDWRGAEHATIDGRTCPLFNPAAPADRWSVADALAYLLAVEVGPSLAAPGWALLERLAGHIDLGEYDAGSRPLREVLADVARRGNLTLRPSRDQAGLVVYRHGFDGRRARLNLQPPGQTLNPARSNVFAASIRQPSFPRRRPVRILGARPLHEVTVTLQPGWTATSAERTWADTRLANLAPDDPTRSIYRRWVLNEHGRYDHIDTVDLATIDPAAFAIRRARRLLPCLSADADGHRYPTAIEYRTAETADWQPWPQAAWTSDDQCAVFLAGEALPGDFFAAARDETLAVRVTAAIEADAPMTAELPGDPGLQTLVLNRPDHFARHIVTPTSRYYTAGDGQDQVLRDDTDQLWELARRSQSTIADQPSQVTVTLAWVDPAFGVGDLAENRLDRTLALGTAGGRRPAVREVTHHFSDKQQTHLLLDY
jgi:hypothetical protein